jgi:hypothetical protein
MPDLPATAIQSTDEQPWASSLPGENGAWFQRFSLYAAMGAGRSVRAVYNAELAERGKPSLRSKPVPSSWTQASHRYEWLRRAEAFDEWRRKQIFNAGNAQDTERIKKLDSLIDKLSSRCLDLLDGLDMAEIKPEDLSRLITALLSAIDLMAKHTGGYPAVRVEHTGKDGGKIEVEETQVSVVFYMPEIEQDALDDLQSDGSDEPVVVDAGEPGL